MKTKRCPVCKRGNLRRWSGTVDRLGIQIDTHGERCDACEEVLCDYEETGRQEAQLAHGLAVRGIRRGNEFALVRKAAGFLAVDLASLLDVTKETVSRWEHDVVPIPRTVAVVVEQLLLHPRIIWPSLMAHAS